MTTRKHPSHPLDQLLPEEIQRAVHIVRTEKALFTRRHRFAAVDLLEPPKSFVLSYKNGQDFQRHATLSICLNDEKRLFDAVVDLREEKIISWTEITEGQPLILGDEFVEAEDVIRNSELFQQALKRRGIGDPQMVWFDPWSVGKYDFEYEKKGKRLMMAVVFLKADSDDNCDGHPIDGLFPIVDLHEMKVVHVEDLKPTLPIPKTCFHYEKKKTYKTFRTDLKPLLISQPEGTSFSVVNNEVQWQKWSFRVGFNAREGLVLHDIKYNDNGKWRSIIYRASLSEMVVPYGDPRPQHVRKNAFDVGDYGVGRCANSLKKGCDCFGDIYYFDGYMNDSKGNVFCIKNAVCLHEEDHGILWKHLNLRTGEGETRRSRRLVVSMYATAANYEYGFYWYFYMDGSLEFEAQLTGVLNIAAAMDNEYPAHGTILAPNLYAPVHQHFFNFRFDMTVDGVNNSIYEVNLEEDGEGPHNPYSNGFHPSFRLLQTDTEARRHVDLKKHRFWKIVNPNSVNHQTGLPVSYRLETHENAFPFAGSNASVTKRACFVKNHVWVTQYNPDELYAAGKYPNQHSGGDGLEKYSSGNKPIVNTDIVLWYTLGFNHVPRCEEFPVMPVATGRFAFKPDGFFTMNPANDVPPNICKSDKAASQKSLRSAL